MKIKKLACLFLVLAVAFISVAASACGDTGTETGGNDSGGVNDGGDNNTVGGDDSNSTVSEAELKERYNPNFEAVDMQGYVFKFGTRDDDAPHHPYPVHTRDLYAEAENGDLINDAVFKRNRYIEDKYNCVIEMDAFLEASGEDQANKIAERSVRAGDKSYDLLMTHMMHGFSSSLLGVFYNIADFPNIDINQPYWNKGANDGCSIGNRLYMGLSDLSFSTNENLYCIFFNKKLIQDLSIENPYQIIAENQWTFETFNRIIRQGYIDLNGDGIADRDDQFGYASGSAMNFLWSGGGQLTNKDANDVPYLDFINDKTIDIYSKALDITQNEYTFAEREWYNEDCIKIFQDGRAVFFSNQLCRVNDLRATEFDFGIVPYPKYDSAQERYYSYVDGHASMMAIPRNLPNPEWTGTIIEEMSFLAYRDILPVYYDVVLNVKLVRDEESAEMLEILFDTKVFDSGYFMSTAGMDLWYMWIENIDNNRTEIVSTYERRENALTRALERNIERILEIEE